MAMSQNWVMLISEQHRYQGVSYKSDIIVVAGRTAGQPDSLASSNLDCNQSLILLKVISNFPSFKILNIGKLGVLTLSLQKDTDKRRTIHFHL